MVLGRNTYGIHRVCGLVLRNVVDSDFCDDTFGIIENFVGPFNFWTKIKGEDDPDVTSSRRAFSQF